MIKDLASKYNFIILKQMMDVKETTWETNQQKNTRICIDK